MWTISATATGSVAKKKYVVRSIWGCKYERMPTIKWLTVKEAVLDEYSAPERKQFEMEADARKAAAMKGHTDPDEYDRAARTVMLDNVIRDPARLRAEAGVDPRPYFYMVACIKDGLKGDLAMPLARGGVDENRAGWQGNRCRILPAHMPFLLLHAARSGNPQEMLESKFGIGQTAISRCLDLALSLLTRPETMPTIMAIADEIAETPGDEVVEAIGHVINCDVTEFEIEAPGDKESNNAAYSAKAYTTTAKAAFACSQAGLLMAMGDIMGSRIHDINALRDTLPFLGDITRSMEDPDTPQDRRMTVNVDKGMQGADKKWPGADVRIPIKRKKGQKKLSDEDRAYNYTIDSPRAIIENQFRRMKVYRLIGGIFRGSIGDLEDMVVFVTGVVNLERIMGCIDPERSHRKAPLSERPSAGWSGRKPYKTFE